MLLGWLVCRRNRATPSGVAGCAQRGFVTAGRILLTVFAFGFLTVGTHAQAQPQQSGTKPTPVAAEPDLINPDRPGIADGSQVIGPRRYQIETGFERDKHSDGTAVTRQVSFPTLFRFGINSRWEARAEGNTFTRSHTKDPGNPETIMSGFAPFSAGFKYHFQDQQATDGTAGGTGGKASLGTIFRIYPASGTRDFRSTGTQADLRLAADWNFTSALSLNPNLGVASYQDSQNHRYTAALFALTLNYFNQNRTVNPFVDMGAQAPESRGGRTALTYDAGMAIIFLRNYQFDFSVGTGGAGNTPPHPFFAGGISARF